MSRPAVGPTQPHFNGYRGSFLGLKRLRHDVEHVPSLSAEVKNEWRLASSPFACPRGADGDNTLMDKYFIQKVIKVNNTRSNFIAVW